MTKNCLLISCFILLFATSTAYSQTLHEQRLVSHVAAFTAANNFQGRILVSENDRIIIDETYGKSNWEKNIPTTSQTRYNICSVGKNFTAVLILQLWEQGKLNLDQSISSLINSSIPNADKITVRQLLTHTSGLGSYHFSPLFVRVRQHQNSLNDLIKIIEKDPLTFDTPGQRHAYSNSGYIVLGKILENHYQMNYGEILQKNIFEPAGMTNSTYNIALLNETTQSEGYVITLSGKVINTKETEPKPASDGGAYVTAYDLLNYDRALRNELLLKKSTMEMMETTSSSASFGPGMSVNYGFGTVIFENKPTQKIVGHMGDITGKHAAFRRWMGDKNYTIIVLANYEIYLMGFMNDLDEILRGKEVPKPLRPASNSLFDQVKKSGTANLANAIEDVLAERNQQRFTRPSTLLSVWNELSLINKIEDAHVVGNYAIESFKDDISSLCTLAQTYMGILSISGSPVHLPDKLLARKAIDQILALAPDHTQALQWKNVLNR